MAERKRSKDDHQEIRERPAGAHRVSRVNVQEDQ